MLDLLLETHIGLERQGPGSSEAIEQALGFLKPLNKFSRIADLGCGAGGQTIHLAQHLSGTITGLDMFATRQALWKIAKLSVNMVWKYLWKNRERNIPA